MSPLEICLVRRIMFSVCFNLEILRLAAENPFSPPLRLSDVCAVKLTSGTVNKCELIYLYLKCKIAILWTTHSSY